MESLKIISEKAVSRKLNYIAYITVFRGFMLHAISCYDFSTFDTIILHDKLKKSLFEIIDFRFKGSDKQLKSVRKYGTK